MSAERRAFRIQCRPFAPEPRASASASIFWASRLFALNDALGKWLVADYGVGQLMMLRSIGAVIVLAPMILSLRVKLFDPRRAPLQLLRILVAAVDTFAFYYATRFMPLADVMTFYMATPLIVTALSAPLLGEKVERFRWIAVLGRLRGVRRRAEAFAADVLLDRAPLALFGAVMFALSQTITRELRGVHWLPLVFWQFVGGGLIGAATVPFAWTHPERCSISPSWPWSASCRWSVSSSSSGRWRWPAPRCWRRCNIRRSCGRRSWAGSFGATRRRCRSSSATRSSSAAGSTWRRGAEWSATR